MRILNNIRIIDLGLHLEKEKILVIADLHIGYEESLNKKGILIPRFQFKDVINRLKNICDKIDFNTVVITGDLKHEFGEITDQEWREIIKLFDFFKGKEIIIVKGNHDAALKPIAEKRNIKIVDHYCIDNICIVHGDKIIYNKDADKCSTIIMGHEHPAISFSNRKNEKFKCFLKGKWENKNLIVVPSFNPIVEGTDVTYGEFLSPYLSNGVDDFDVFVVEDTVYRFGKVKKLRNV